jgi:Putative Flp pilus-assembly TadE/G-like/Putative Tad-like Flp pilus-assembly
MRRMLGCRRGSVAFATVGAMVPLVGFVALGAEAGSWYVTKQHAQTAADAAAYSGGLWLACSQVTGCTDQTSKTLDYRAKQFASQNAFCDAADTTSYPGSKCTSHPSGISQAVTVSVAGNIVQATVSQQQPAYLAKILGLSTVNVGATAKAEVKILAQPCVLSLHDPISFQGSTTVTSPKCGLASNSTAQNSIDFTGNGLNVSNAGSISGQGGCADTGGAQCSKAITYAPPVPNPMSGLDSAMSSLTTASFSGTCGSTLTAYGPGSAACYNNGFTFGNQTYNLNGVYFFAGNLNIQGNANITGTATLILLPNPPFAKPSLTVSGNPTIQITAPTSVTTTQVPAALASVVGLMSKLLIYDPEAYSKNGVTISGNSTNYLSGIVYVPNTPVTYQGSTVSSTCTEIIAYGVTLSGNSNFDNSTCSASVTPTSRIVRLVP